MIFLRDSLCLSAVTLPRQRRDILDFSNCPLSRVLHVTLANWQGFGFEFHLRSSPSYWVFGYQSTSWYFIACYTVLMRPKKVETAVPGCNCWLSVWTLSRRCPVKLFTQYQPCIIVCYFLVLADQIFCRSCVHRQHFRLRSFASLCFIIFKGPFNYLNDRFPYPLWNPYPFIYLKPEKGTPFGRSLPV